MKRKIWIGAGILAAVLLLSAIWLLDIPNWKTLDTKLLTHLQSASVVYDRDGNEAFSLYGTQKRRTVSLEALPEYVPQAFVAAEDQRFYRHNGIDVRRIFGAALSNFRHGSLAEGASTITQQLIKLTHLSPEKTFRRKISEARLAMQAERVFTKEEILEMYMNVVYFGNGAYGIDMAAETYFGKRAAELSVSEAAMLAGVIKSPNAYSPRESMEKALQRRDYVLSQMLECGFIDENTHRQAKNDEIDLAVAMDSGITGWYRDAVIREATEILQIETAELLGGGYRIDTALDMQMQRQADQCMAEAGTFPNADVQGALVAVDPNDGGVLALCGGRQDDVRMGLDRAMESLRQPGSIMKPISVYAAAVDSMGFLPSDFLDDTQRVFAGGYMPRNASEKYYGTVTLRTALSKSLNVATVSLAEQVGVPAMRNYARRFGVDVENDDAQLSFALGSMTYGVTPAQMAGAYASLANGGLSVDVHLITKITDRRGNVVYQWKDQPQRIVSQETAALITDMLSTAAADGTAREIGRIGFPAAAKTGTVSQDGGTRDAWTLAYTPDVAVAVWMGYDSAADGVMPAEVHGSGYPARLAAAWLTGIQDQLSRRDFLLPETLERVSLDKISLEQDQSVLLADEHTPVAEQIAEIFPTNRLPQRTSMRYAAPQGVSQAAVTANGLGYPVIRFTALQDGMEHLILRHQDGQIRCVATLTGAPGDMLEYTDADASLLSAAEYQIVTRQRELYGKGTLLTDAKSEMLHFAPLMAKIDSIVPSPEPETSPESSPAPLFAP